MIFVGSGIFLQSQFFYAFLRISIFFDVGMKVVEFYDEIIENRQKELAEKYNFKKGEAEIVFVIDS